MKDTDTNRRRTEQVERLIREMLVTGLQRGTYGTASLDIVISDGTIQSLRQRWERTHK